MQFLGGLNVILNPQMKLFGNWLEISGCEREAAGWRLPVSVLAAGCAEEKQLFLEMWIRSRHAPSCCHLWVLLVLIFGKDAWLYSSLLVLDVPA